MPHFSPGFFHNNGEISRHRKNVSIVVKSTMEYQSVAIVVGNDVVMGEFTRSTVSIHCCQLGHYHWTFPTNVSPSALESATRGTWIIIDKRAATLCFPCQSDVWLTFFSLPSLNSIIGRGPVVNVSQVVILTDNVLYKLCFFFICFFVVLQRNKFQSMTEKGPKI